MKGEKITQLPGARMTPETLLARLLERAKKGEFRSVYVGLEYAEDDGFNCCYSVMDAGAQFCHARVAQDAAADAFYDRADPDRVETVPPPPEQGA